MSNDFLFLSFCNQSFSPSHAALLASLSGDQFQWIDLSSLPGADVGSFSGVCGVCEVPGGVVFVTQGERVFLVYYSFEAIGSLASWIELSLCKDAHSVVFFDNYVYVVSTGTNQVVRTSFANKSFGLEEHYWSFPGVDNDRDIVHLNGLSLDGGRLIASCFGERNSSGHWSDRGQVFYLDTGEIICDGLTQPHSPLIQEEWFYVAESKKHCVFAYERVALDWCLRWCIDVGGYARGLVRYEDQLLVGISASRKYSRSTSLPLESFDSSDAHVIAVSSDGKSSRMLSVLDGFGYEIYELLPLRCLGEPMTRHEALLLRMKEAERLFKSYMTDYERALFALNDERKERDLITQDRLVSIIMPTYNRGHLIRESIISVLEQSYRGFELIIIDDGSSDNTREVVLSFDDPRVRYVYQDNMGRSVARNRAAAIAKGKYLAFIDSDDLFLPGKLALQVAYLDTHPGVGLVYTSAYCIDDFGNYLEHKYLAERSGFIYKDIAFFTAVTVTLPTVMTYKKIFDSVGGFDESMHRFEDTDLWRRVSKNYRIDAISEFTCLLRTHVGNSLAVQCPDEIERAIDYYAEKILHEDSEFDFRDRCIGLSGLYRYYSVALLADKFSEVGNRLLAKSFQYERMSLSGLHSEAGVPKSEPLVSVILPTYNRGHLLRESIFSVLNQTYRNFELIVVDDGSTDETASVVAAIADSRIRYVYQQNGGRSKARNHALSLAQGELIAFLDSDDIYLPDKLARQVVYLQSHPGTRMIYTSAHCIDASGQYLEHKYYAEKSGHLYEDIAFFTPVTITLPTVMAYKEIFDHVGGFDEGMHRFEDTDMWRRISKICRIDAMPEFTCLLRTHAGNVLESQCGASIENSILYYAEKIMAEDNDIDLAVRYGGIAGLFRYYGLAMLSVPRFSEVGVRLLEQEKKYLKMKASVSSVRFSREFIVSILSRVVRRGRGAVKYCYYHLLNFLYRNYSLLKKIIKG